MKKASSIIRSHEPKGGLYKVFYSAVFIMLGWMTYGQSYVFTTASATGNTGPTQAMLDTEYSSTNLAGKVTSDNGIQYWVVPASGNYKIEALGGQGYGAFGGRGAQISGEFTLNAGDTLKILVGQMAGHYLDYPANTYNHQFGGGGGSFITYTDNSPLIVAGGGGGNHGTAYLASCDGQITNAGAAGINAATIGAGGTSGLGGQQASSADAGGGLLGDGTGTAGGIAFVNGGLGGIDEGTGGFGGGGGTSSWNNYRGGGGGGYSGGGAANNGGTCCPSAGGGGSYNGGINQQDSAGVQIGDGLITISALTPGPVVIKNCYNTIPAAFNNVDSAKGGSGSYLYQWQQSLDYGNTWSAAYGVNNNIVYSPSLALTDTMFYRRLVIDPSCGDSAFSNTIEIHVPDTLQLNTSISALSCNGASDGSIDLTVIGGAAPFSYVWSNSATTEDMTGLVSGTYTVTVTDDFGCSITDSFTVTEPAALVASSVVDSNITCNGNSDGGLTASLTGGTSPYTYVWSNGATASSTNGLVAGTYTVTITDANGCTSSSSATVTEPAVLVAAATLDSNETCSGASNGGVSSSATGGTMPYNYMWSNGATTASVTGITSGTYTVTITDANGCTASASQSVIMVDTIAPFIQLPITPSDTIPIYLDSSGFLSAFVPTNAFVSSGYVSDSCGIDTAYYDINTINCTHIGYLPITIHAKDINGNSSSMSFHAEVIDTTRPTVIVQNHTVYLNASGNASITTADIDNGTTDACGIDTLTLSQYNFDCSHVGDVATYLIATDVNGNKDSSQIYVTVIDTIKPVLATKNVTAYLDATGNTSINATFIDNGTADECGLDTLLLSKYDFDCSIVGANTITFTAKDVNNNSISTTATVTVVDTISPTAVAQNINVYLDATGNRTITAADVDNGSADACGLDTLVISQYNFDCSHVGANNVTLTATDVNSNSSSETIIVTVIDTIKPVVAAQNTTIYLDAMGQASIVDSDLENGSTDACGIASSALSQYNFDCTHTGANTVYLAIIDVNGNIDSAAATVNVYDTINPVANVKSITAYLDASGVATVTAADVDNGSSDNCTFTLSLSQTTFDCTETGLNLKTFTITDASGNKDSKDAWVTIKDTISPSLHLKKTLTVSLDQFGNASISAAQLDSASADNCSNLLFFTVNKTSFGCAELGANTVTVTAYDNKNNSTTGTATVMVMDYMAPVVSTQNITAYLNASGVVTVAANAVNNGTTDNCTIDSLWLDKDNFSCADLGQNIVKLYAKDQSGNTAQGNAVITVSDTISPVVVAQNMTVYLDASGTTTITASSLNNGSSDNCAVQSVSVNKTTFDCSDLGANLVQLTVVDAHANSTTATATVTVIDTISPSVVAQNITVSLDATGSATIVASDIDNGSSDACGIQSMSLDVTGFTCTELGANTVTLTVTDNNSNVSVKTATVTVVDNVTPVVATQNITIYLDATGNAAITPSDVNNGSTDNCGITTYSLDISTFDCADLGQNLVILSATDASNNTGTKSAFVTVLDTIDPAITNLPATITAYAPANQCAANVQWPAIIGSDNCGVSMVNTSKANGALFQLGTTVVTVTVTDASSNTISKSFNVVVVDTVAPSVSNVPTNYTVIANNNSCDAVVNWIEPVAIDNCGGVTWTKSHIPGATFPVGNTTVTYTATDSDNNATTVSFVVTVTDQVAPVVSGVPANITVSADAGSCDATVNYTMPAVSDNCSGATISSTQVSGSVFPIGTTTVAFTATDAANNVTTASFTVTVEDNQKPVVSSMPANDTVGSCGATYTYAMPVATDNCSSVSVVQTSGLPSGSIFPAGITVNTFKISDANGNDTVVSFTLVVVPQGTPDLPSLLEICENMPAVELSFGQNMVWSGKGIIAAGTQFDPATAGAGRHQLSYVFTDGMGCDVSGSISVTVLPQPIKPVVSRIGSTTLSTGNYNTYQWYRDGVLIPGATNQNYAYNQGGNYQVMVTNNSGCENYSDGMVVGQAGGGIGIEENLFGDLDLYPNPSNGVVTIDINRNELEELSLVIFNTAGKMVYELTEQTSYEGKLSIDLSHLPDATYMLRITSGGEVAVKRVVIY